MKLYGFDRSRWQKPYWLLEELGIEFEAVVLDFMKGEHKGETYLQINPLGKVPALVDGDVTLFESTAICRYLSEKYADKGLLPASLAERALVHQWLDFALTELEAPLYLMARNQAFLPEAQRSPQAIEVAAGDFKVAAQVLNDHMEGREHLVGDSFSVADIAVGYALIWASWFGMLDDYQNLVSYVERLRARPKIPSLLKQPYSHSP